MELKQGFIIEDEEKENKAIDYLSFKKYTSVLNEDSEEIFRSLSDAKLGNIKGVIDDINELIDKRQKLTSELFSDIDKTNIEINNSLLELKTIINSPNVNKDELIRAQLELRKKLIELEEVRMQEKVNNWRDIALLKKELRDRVREFKEKETSVSLLDKILEE